VAKILIVDDALFMRKMLSDILISKGHEIVGQAENAKDAITLYQELKPDLVTMDIIMPEVDQITALKAVQEIVKFDKQAKIIMVSAMGQQEIVVELIQAGAKDFIVKPFHPENVIKAVENALRK
jgi:two-component system chemotaxis response regulator CheY